MGGLLVFGSLMTGLGPSLVIFSLVTFPNPEHLVLFITSAFVFMCGMVINSLLFLSAPQIFDKASAVVLIFSTINFEILRFLMYKLYTRSEKAMSLPLSNRLTAAITVGLGFALTNCILTNVSQVMFSSGPGSLFIKGCPEISVFVLSAVLSGCMNLSSVFCSILAFDGWQRGGMSRWRNAVVVVYRLLFSLITLGTNNGCGYVMAWLIILTISIGFLTLWCVYRPMAFARKLRLY